MLDPRDRQLLLESLRPPEGYSLSGALGTSYTLDLIALLTAPLAFTLYDWEDEDGNTISPLALLESVRRHAGKITLFCQAGEIKVPPPAQRLIAYLEPCVAEVNAPHSAGVFHPKVWLLRYTANGKPVRYRFLCLSRNLTFDKCWDSILTLDGELLERRNAISSNHPLGDFIDALPSLAVRPMAEARGALVRRMAEEIRRVRFELPSGVDDVAFWPMGFDSRRRWPFVASTRPMLVMSPFISPPLLLELTENRKNCVLVSRPDDLARQSEEVLAAFSNVYTMDQSAEQLDASESYEGHQELAGLHAKLFVEDDGWNARIYTGSANATDAAFGRNVEFLVELRGKKSELGIDAFLGTGAENGFGRLLTPWKGELGTVSEGERIREVLEQRLAAIRRSLASRSLTVKCRKADEKRFTLELACLEAFDVDVNVEVKCWPSSLRAEDGHIPESRPGTIAMFGPLSGDAITGFFVFELVTRQESVSAASRFVLSLPLEGAPADRLEKLLASQLRNKEQVLRFIWLLLQSELSGTEAAELTASMLEGSTAAGGTIEGYPILERLVSSLGDSVTRARDVGRVIEDLMKSNEGRSLLPEGLTELWAEIKAIVEERDVESA